MAICLGSMPVRCTGHVATSRLTKWLQWGCGSGNSRIARRSLPVDQASARGRRGAGHRSRKAGCANPADGRPAEDRQAHRRRAYQPGAEAVAWPSAEARQGERHRQRPGRRAATLIAYFDTSAFVKLVVEERDSPRVTALWNNADRRFSSRLLYPESRAALAAARPGGRLGPVTAAAARTELERRWSGVED